jgi:hypothetical protein
MLLVTFVMHTMTTRLPISIENNYHENDCGSRSEHVFSTNRTVRFEISFNTLMFSFQTNSHTYIASRTVKIVDTKAFPYTTNSTVMAMVNILSCIVVPEFTFFTVVCGYSTIAIGIYTNLSSRLDLPTVHTHHCFNEISG